jgi:hypothetical protein
MGDMQAMVDLYQSDIITIERVLEQLNRLQGSRQNLEMFVQEVEARFAEVGFRVEVITFQDENDPDFYGFNFVIRDRIDPIEFDHDKMRHEVQHDLLGLSQPGALTRDGTWIEPPSSTSMSTPEKPTSN